MSLEDWERADADFSLVAEKALPAIAQTAKIVMRKLRESGFQAPDYFVLRDGKMQLVCKDGFDRPLKVIEVTPGRFRFFEYIARRSQSPKQRFVGSYLVPLE